MSRFLDKLRYVVAFPIGLITYAIGFAVGGLLGDLFVMLSVILPPMVDTSKVGLTGAALAANALSLFCFGKLIPDSENKSKWVFSFVIVLLVIGIVYTISCFIFDSIHLLWYGILSSLICTWVIYDVRKEAKAVMD